jgi:hypothetical protein
LLLQRIEKILDAAQPEEQIGFRAGRRLEEHLLTTTLLLEKCGLHNVPLWIISLDLTKAFDKVIWPALWAALLEQGVPEYLVLAIQRLYELQFGVVKAGGVESDRFDIFSGVRQGCVLSPRLFSSVLEFAMRKWRLKTQHFGFDLADGGSKLTDLRLADDLLVVAGTRTAVLELLDGLVAELRLAGLVLNNEKTKVITNEAQPPASVTSAGGISLNVLSRDEAHKWLGCMIGASVQHGHAKDVEFHLQAAARAFYANRAALCDRNVSIIARLRLFASVVTSVACFASGHRTPRRPDIDKMDVAFRSFGRQIVGPPPNADWTRPYHVTLHEWNERLDEFVRRARIRSWGKECLRHFFRLAGFVARLPQSRWVRRILEWSPASPRRLGRPPFCWTDLLVCFCCARGLGDNWLSFAACEKRWLMLESAFLAC